jgi:endoglucanase
MTQGSAHRDGRGEDRTTRRECLSRTAAVVASAAAITLDSGLASAAKGKVPADRVAKLSRGANVCLWFRYLGNADESHFKTHFTADDAKRLRDWGLGHVRLPLAPDVVFRKGEYAWDDRRLKHVEQAISLLLDQGLAVVVDVHGERGQAGKDLEQDLLLQPNGVERLADLWRGLARQLRGYPADRVFLELLNEPVFERREREWPGLADQLVRAMRTSAPDHTFVVGGPVWSSVYGLVEYMRPVSDSNVVYTFHFYEPFAFTHQGAEWTDPAHRNTRAVPYPVPPAGQDKILAQQPAGASREAVRKYLSEGWNRDKLQGEMTKAIRWGEKYGVPLYLGEFGAYPRVMLADDRRRWFEDIRLVLEAAGVGWSIWGYDEGLGLGRRRLPNGAVAFDETVVKALELTGR